jgi:hypothetical protein
MLPTSFYIQFSQESFDTRVREALTKVNVHRLLVEEKRRRGFDAEKLVFIGMADTASLYWCSMKSFFSNLRMEIAFFASYLHDRLTYSLELGYIKEVPGDERALLSIGDEITQSDIEKLLKKRRKGVQKPSSSLLLSNVITGEKLLIINPHLPKEKKERMEGSAQKRGIRIGNLNDLPPKLRGELCEEFIAERYPTIRWNFEWDDFVIVGVPDGISDEFVYEFKTTGSEFLLSYLEPCALMQGDLYGHFFKRSYKRVQVYVMDEQNVYTWHEPVDSGKAVELLEAFKKVCEDGGASPSERWKCRSCENKKTCPVKHTQL